MQQHNHHHTITPTTTTTTSNLRKSAKRGHWSSVYPSIHTTTFHTDTRNRTKDSTPPHEGVVKASSQTGVSIEQLFEDCYSLPAHRQSCSALPHHDHSSSASGILAHAHDGLGIKGSHAMPASRAVAAQRRLAKMSLGLSITTSSSSSKTSTVSCSSVDPHLRRKTSSIPSLPSAPGSHRRADINGATPIRAIMSRSARSARGVSAGGSNGAGEAFTPVSGATALKEYGSRLTESEKQEVKAFKTVYYLGQMSAKRAAREEAEKNEGFDDKDGFYICKPHDHLLFRYEIYDLLGKGTFGQVAKAWDHKMGSLVAMKIVKNERPFLRQAKEEVRILEVLKKQDKHDLLNIVHILDSFKFRGHVCIAFELLGISLHQLLKKTRGQGFSLNRVQKLTRGILRCLELLSKNRIIHCDIKPENILLRRSAPGVSASSGTGFSDSSIKVIDFGSSCYEQQQIYTYIQSRYYRAPEVILGARYSSAIDMWSLACVIGELLTSQPLFGGDDEHDQLASIMEIRGVPPMGLMSRCKRWDKFFTGEVPRYINGPGKAARRGQPLSVSLSSALKDTEDTVFLDFMQKALTWDPGNRLTASEALQHAWIMRGQGAKSATDTRTPSGPMPQEPCKTKSHEKPSQPDSISGARHRGSGNGNSKPASGSTRTSSTTTATTTTTTGSGSNNALTAKLPSQLTRPHSNSRQRGAARTHTGPVVAPLPPWDAG